MHRNIAVFVTGALGPMPYLHLQLMTKPAPLSPNRQGQLANSKKPLTVKQYLHLRMDRCFTLTDYIASAANFGRNGHVIGLAFPGGQAQPNRQRILATDSFAGNGWTNRLAIMMRHCIGGQVVLSST